MIELKTFYANWLLLIPLFIGVIVLLTMPLFKTKKALKAGGLGLGTLVIVGGIFYTIMDNANLLILFSFMVLGGLVILLI